MAQSQAGLWAGRNTTGQRPRPPEFKMPLQRPDRKIRKDNELIKLFSINERDNTLSFATLSAKEIYKKAQNAKTEQTK